MPKSKNEAQKGGSKSRGQLQCPDKRQRPGLRSHKKQVPEAGGAARVGQTPPRSLSQVLPSTPPFQEGCPQIRQRAVPPPELWMEPNSLGHVPPRLSGEQPGLPWEVAFTVSDTPNAEPGPRSNLRPERAFGESSETCVFLSITKTPREQSPAQLLHGHVTSVSDMWEVTPVAGPTSPHFSSLTHHTHSLRTSDNVPFPQRRGNDGGMGFIHAKEPR